MKVEKDSERNYNKKEGNEPYYFSLKDHICGFRVDQRSDRVLWRWKADGKFTMKSIYAVLSDGGTRDARANKLWGLHIPLKVQVFTWLVLKKRPLTTNNLIKRGWTGNTTCVLCGIEGETVNHLFSRCVFNRFMIAMAVKGVQPIELNCDSLFGRLDLIALLQSFLRMNIV
uniref:Reverse transcriptase zinc-binding domain-containing protein n=1 Tax=Ananas comosus var. bracteatus TaxID=296719 RepID=A0A6V7NFQ0_ANACO|nr:unnamed protein product [Ananas comosus var. bracteatus]